MGTLFFGGIIVDFIYASYDKSKRYNAVKNAFFKGNCHGPDVQNLIERPDVEKDLKEIVEPQSKHCKYNFSLTLYNSLDQLLLRDNG